MLFLLSVVLLNHIGEVVPADAVRQQPCVGAAELAALAGKIQGAYIPRLQQQTLGILQIGVPYLYAATPISIS